MGPLILHKDNASKYKILILNDDLFFKGKKLSKPSWPYMKNVLSPPVKSWNTLFILEHIIL